jgi:integrase/recombinase XerD
VSRGGSRKGRPGNWHRPEPEAIIPALAAARGRRKEKPPIGDIADRRSLEWHIREFIEWSMVRGFSEHTISSRQREMNRLHAWLVERGVTRTSEVTKPMLDRYQRWLFHYRKANGQPLTFLTQKGRLMPVRQFFSWATKTNRILYNPASDIEMPRVEHRLPKHVLTANEVEQVMSLPDLAKPLGLRDRAILELFYATGMRRGEVARLRIYDIDVDRRAVRINQAKGKKDRIVPITERALVWLLRYMRDIRPRLAVEPDDGYVFLAIDGQPLALNHITVMVSRYVTRAELGKTGSCHLLRHTMATLLLEGGADIRFIQAILGHADLATTEVYTRVSVAQLLSVVDACHPGATNARTRDRGLDGDETPAPAAMAELLTALDDDPDDSDEPTGTDHQEEAS